MCEVDLLARVSQLRYAELRESNRHNTTVEKETGRHNVETERIGYGTLANFDFVDLPPIDAYTHMIKRQPKAKLDCSVQTDYPALQTIVYNPKSVNAVFGPAYRD